MFLRISASIISIGERVVFQIEERSIFSLSRCLFPGSVVPFLRRKSRGPKSVVRATRERIQRRYFLMRTDENARVYLRSGNVCWRKMKRRGESFSRGVNTRAPAIRLIIYWSAEGEFPFHAVFQLACRICVCVIRLDEYRRTSRGPRTFQINFTIVNFIFERLVKRPVIAISTELFKKSSSCNFVSRFNKITSSVRTCRRRANK